MTKRDRERNLSQRQDFAELMKHYPFTMETLAGEEWRDIEGYEGLYQVSNYGRVKSFAQSRPHILKSFLDRQGYLTCRLCLQGEQKYSVIHKLVAKAFIPNPNDKPQVNHIDGIKWNSVLTNLEWVTRSENARHADNTGLRESPQGEKVWNAKLTNEQALYIRENPDQLNGRQLADKFDVSRATIIDIQLGRKYRYVGGSVRSKKGIIFPKLSPEIHEEIRRLHQTGEYTQRQLGDIFGVANQTINGIVHKIDRRNGHKTNYKWRLPEDIREKIRSEYVRGSREFGQQALARKYGVGQSMIWRILNEK